MQVRWGRVVPDLDVLLGRQRGRQASPCQGVLRDDQYAQGAGLPHAVDRGWRHCLLRARLGGCVKVTEEAWKLTDHATTSRVLCSQITIRHHVSQRFPQGLSK
jgi:hypothetical protein